LTIAQADSLYLRLDATNDPLTGALDAFGGDSAVSPNVAVDAGEGIYDCGADIFCVAAGAVSMLQFGGTIAGGGTMAIGTAFAIEALEFIFQPSSAANPSIALTGDQDTGLYGNATGEAIGIAINGVSLIEANDDGVHMLEVGDNVVPDYFALPRAIGNQAVKGTCTSAKEGFMIFVDDTDDAAAGAICVCSGNVAHTTFTWVNTLGTACAGG